MIKSLRTENKILQFGTTKTRNADEVQERTFSKTVRKSSEMKL